MSSYSGASAPGGIPAVLCQDGLQFITILAVRKYGEGVTAAASLQQIKHTTGSTAASLGGFTAEKFNTLSGTILVVIGGGIPDGVSTTLYSFGTANFTHCSIVFSKRYTPVLQQTGEALYYAAGSNFEAGSLEVSVPATGPDRSVRRRPTKRGWWILYGNSSVTNHEVTGTFQIFASHFNTDTTWSDAFSWRLGTRIEPLNINLFPPSAGAITSERTLLGVGT